jgi:RNA polymerase sigma-70 factor (ECF subfamily)
LFLKDEHAEERRMSELRDQKAIADLYDRYGGRVYGYLLLMLNSHAETEDAVQEVFCGIWERGLAGRAIENPAGYLFRTAHNEACSRLRRKWRRWIRFGAFNGQAPVLESSEPSGNTLEDREAVAHALSRLPAKQREVVALKIFQDLTFGEIAQALDISLNTAASRYRYALEKLERLLKEEGFGS